MHEYSGCFFASFLREQCVCSHTYMCWSCEQSGYTTISMTTLPGLYSLFYRNTCVCVFANDQMSRRGWLVATGWMHPGLGQVLLSPYTSAHVCNQCGWHAIYPLHVCLLGSNSSSSAENCA